MKPRECVLCGGRVKATYDKDRFEVDFKCTVCDKLVGVVHLEAVLTELATQTFNEPIDA